MVKNPPANAGDVRDSGSVPGSGRSSGEGNGNLLHYSCLGNPMDRETLWAIIHRAAKSQTRLKWLRTLTLILRPVQILWKTCPKKFFSSFTRIVNITMFPVGIYPQFYMKSYRAERQVQPALEAEIMYVPAWNYPTGYWEGWWLLKYWNKNLWCVHGFSTSSTTYELFDFDCNGFNCRKPWWLRQ